MSTEQLVEAPITVSILVPTYMRPADLAQCLAALQGQTRPADQIVVVRRDTDEQTGELLSRLEFSKSLLTVVVVKRPGVVAAMKAGLAAASGDIVALTDDDTEPRPDWIERIMAHFSADSTIAGVGGRDWQPRETGDREIVGTVSWYGYTVGNHHLGVGKPRYVDLLKGANCAYRRILLQEIGFDERLKGKGAQVHWELALCLALRRAGWKLLYDPAVAIDHYPGERFDSDNYLRGASSINQEAIINAVHNETFILLQHLRPLGKAAFVLWSIIVGTRASPGVIQLARLLHIKEPCAWQRWQATLVGQIDGARSFIARKQPKPPLKPRANAN